VNWSIAVPLALSIACLVVIAVLRRRILKREADQIHARVERLIEHERAPVVDVTMRYGLDEGERDRMIRDALVLVEVHLRAGRSFTLRYRNERQAPGA